MTIFVLILAEIAEFKHILNKYALVFYHCPKILNYFNNNDYL